MHKEPAFGFFQKGIREFEISPSPQLASYLFGFACHFMLDSTCHGYVGRFEKQTGISHAEIETELDRYLMIESGKEPRVYLPASVLDDSEENCRVIARMFPSVTPKQIHRALEGQKLYDRLLTCKNPMKEKQDHRLLSYASQITMIPFRINRLHSTRFSFIIHLVSILQHTI